MKMFSFKENSDTLVILLEDLALRCDLHHRYIDLLYTKRFAHQRVIRSQPLQEVSSYDLEILLKSTFQLMQEFTVPAYHIVNVYRHDRNDRFVLMECSPGLRLEIDKELNGLKDCSKRSYSNMYKRKPDNYFKDVVINEYLRILKEQKRTFEMSQAIIQRNRRPI